MLILQGRIFKEEYDIFPALQNYFITVMVLCGNSQLDY